VLPLPHCQFLLLPYRRFLPHCQQLQEKTHQAKAKQSKPTKPNIKTKTLFLWIHKIKTVELENSKRRVLEEEI
jgi:hypothetical protein